MQGFIWLFLNGLLKIWTMLSLFARSVSSRVGGAVRMLRDAGLIFRLSSVSVNAGAEMHM